MKKVFVLLLLVSICAIAQTASKESAPAKKSATNSTTVNAALLQDVWTQWCTLNPANPAKYYDKSSSNIYFDITPLEYHGWSKYASGVVQVLAGMKTGSSKVDEIRIHPAGSTIWTSAIVHLDMVMKDGSKSKADWRWTSIWEKRGADWKIVHEHVSAPEK
ncbi:MAG: hypothetical protein JWO13_1601 [Acidobacteriales bacterium]|nr:hypothetical protein [Terriglobales bacterium]